MSKNKKIERSGNKKVLNKHLLIGVAVFLFLLFVVFYFQRTDEGASSGVGESSLSEREGAEENNSEVNLIDDEISDDEDEDEQNVSKKRKKRFVGEGEISSEGILRVVNAVYAYTSSAYKIIHFEGASEGLDEHDRDFYAMFDPTGVTTKAVVVIEGREIDSDFRPSNSASEVRLEFSLVSQTGADINVNSRNEIRLSLPRADEGYNFTGKTITLQQYNPDDESEVYLIYNARDVIANDGGVIPLSNVSGTYVSEEPFAYFKIFFS